MRKLTAICRKCGTDFHPDNDEELVFKDGYIDWRCEDCREPSLAQKLKNLSGTMKDVMKKVATDGEIMANKELVDKRMKLCEECSEFIQKTRKCKACGCYLDLKIKLTAAKCILDEW